MICDSGVYQLRNWLIIFIICELVKLYAQLHLRRAVRENELYLTGVSLKVRLLGFAVDNVCFIWLLYGNVLYYNAPPQCEIGFVFSSMFCSILIYGYSCMIKFAFEFVVVFCVVPIWSFICYLQPKDEITLKLTKVFLL